MRVWIYALKESLRFAIGLALAVGLTIVLTWLAISGFKSPPHDYVERMAIVAFAALVVGFPASAVRIRLAVRKANRKKVGAAK